MELENTILSEIFQTQKDTDFMFSLMGFHSSESLDVITESAETIDTGKIKGDYCQESSGTKEREIAGFG